MQSVNIDAQEPAVSSSSIQSSSAVRSLADQISRLKKLYELSMTLSGDPLEVFAHVARIIGELLDVKVVCLSEVKGDKLEFLSVYVDGQIYMNAGTCFLDITPCASVESSKDFRVYDRVMERFPEATFLKDHNAFSYCGFPALDNDGRVVAVTCLLDDRPHEFSEEDQEILRIFGQRIGMELERKNHIMAREQAEVELRKHRDHLDLLVKERTAQLDELNQELEAFSYSVSHDLRAPLRAIDGFSQAVIEDYEDRLDEVGNDYLRRIRGGSQRMGQLIDDMLSLSRIGRMSMHRGTVNLTSMAENIIQRLKDSAPERKVEFEIGAGMTAVGDANILSIALDNLISNAWKYTSKVPAARIRFGTCETAQGKAFFIADNGAGFDMAYADKLFVPFQRLHERKDFEGTGVGLSIVNRVMQRHHGRVWAESKVGEGATFYFMLPEPSASLPVR